MRLAEEKTKKSEVAREEEARRIFTSRSVKEQLEDASLRLNRILSERERERRQAHEREEQSGNRIVLL